jgi:hypothetical protein
MCFVIPQSSSNKLGVVLGYCSAVSLTAYIGGSKHFVIHGHVKQQISEDQYSVSSVKYLTLYKCNGY